MSDRCFKFFWCSD